MFDSLIESLNWIVDKLLNLLPVSPFTEPIKKFSELPQLGYLNWLIPVGDCLVILSGWLTAIALFYVYKAILANVGAFGS